MDLQISNKSLKEPVRCTASGSMRYLGAPGTDATLELAPREVRAVLVEAGPPPGRRVRALAVVEEAPVVEPGPPLPTPPPAGPLAAICRSCRRVAATASCSASLAVATMDAWRAVAAALAASRVAAKPRSMVGWWVGRKEGDEQKTSESHWQPQSSRWQNHDVTCHTTTSSSLSGRGSGTAGSGWWLERGGERKRWLSWTGKKEKVTDQKKHERGLMDGMGCLVACCM